MRTRSRRSALALALLLSSLAGCLCVRRSPTGSYAFRLAEILDRVHSAYVGAIASCTRSADACAVAGRDLTRGAKEAKEEVSRLETPEGASLARLRVLEALDRWVGVGEAIEAVYWDRSQEGAVRALQTASRAAEDAVKLEAAALVASE